MNLENFVGEHTLLGVDFYNEQVERYGYREESAHCLFELDSGTYVVIENPGDGYRSHMDEIRKVDIQAKNRFPGERVVAKFSQGEERYQTDDVVEFVSIATGKVVLAIGTRNTDDYYPWFCAEYSPENMSVNASEPNQ